MPGQERGHELLLVGVEAELSCYAPQVWANDKAGTRVVDPGPGVESRSLALAGRTVYRTRAGVPVSTIIE